MPIIEKGCVSQPASVSAVERIDNALSEFRKIVSTVPDGGTLLMAGEALQNQLVGKAPANPGQRVSNYSDVGFCKVQAGLSRAFAFLSGVSEQAGYQEVDYKQEQPLVVANTVSGAGPVQATSNVTVQDLKLNEKSSQAHRAHLDELLKPYYTVLGDVSKGRAERTQALANFQSTLDQYIEAGVTQYAESLRSRMSPSADATKLAGALTQMAGVVGEIRKYQQSFVDAVSDDSGRPSVADPKSLSSLVRVVANFRATSASLAPE